jgi:hypothetical protein
VKCVEDPAEASICPLPENGEYGQYLHGVVRKWYYFINTELPGI